MIDEFDYCRQIETYLCQKNEGHLIRIVGPVFEKVCGWAREGVPLKVAFRGIDQYCERYYAKGPRRRPVRVEFCEADILELFDDWCRAVGVATVGAESAAPRRQSLAAHLERVVARLVGRGEEDERRSAAFRGAIDSIVRSLDHVAAEAAHARGGARTSAIERLAELDRQLLDAAERELDAAGAAELHGEAEEEVAPFGQRLPPETRERARRAAYERLLREHLRLPTIGYD